MYYFGVAFGVAGVLRRPIISTSPCSSTTAQYVPHAPVSIILALNALYLRATAKREGNAFRETKPSLATACTRHEPPESG